MVGEIAAQHVLPQEVVERVSERTGGVPLFVEEVTRLLVERGEQGGDRRRVPPPRLQQSLAARLDRLGKKRVRWRRSARYWDATSPTSCCAMWPNWMTFRRFNPRAGAAY